MKGILAKMSTSWRYISESDENQITEIWCDGPLEHSKRVGIPIYPWRVRLATGDVRGLYSLALSDFSGADRKALENALKNAQELRESWNGMTLRKVEEVKNDSCWTCC